jgi:hypothetical protein
MMRIQVGNNKWLDAIMLPGDEYQTTHADGTIHIYPADKIRKVEIDGEVSLRDQDVKEDIMNKITQVLLKKEFEGVTSEGKFCRFNANVRMLYSPLPEAMKADYDQSLINKAPVNRVFAITSGSYMFPLLQKRLVDKGIPFHSMSMKMEDVKKLSRRALKKLVDHTTFCFPTSSYAHFLRVEGTIEYGLGVLGISIIDAKKSSKRLMELLRMAQSFLYLEGIDAMKTISFAFPEVAGDEKLYDGMLWCRKSFAVRNALNIADPTRRFRLVDEIVTGKATEFGVRLMTPWGMLKGHMGVCPNSQLSADVVSHPVNIKDELTTDGFILCTMWGHDLFNTAVWNDQSTGHFGELYSEERQVADVQRLVDLVRDSITNGVLPDFITKGATGHNEHGVPVDPERLSKLMNQTWNRLHTFTDLEDKPLDVKIAQNIVYMATNGMLLQMRKFGMVEGFYKKMWIPMTNAVSCSVVTWENATRLGGFSFPGRNRDVSFFDPRVGFVMSGRRFVETFNIHDTWDQDDVALIKLVKVYCSDPAILKQHLGLTIPATSIVRAKAEEARIMISMVRSPNAPGGFAFEECDINSLPIPKELLRDDIDVIDLVNMPLPLDVLMSTSTITGLSSSIVYTGQEMTRADAQASIEAQMQNLSVGQFINPQIIRNTIMPGYPSVMLDELGNCIDAMQQGRDPVQFAEIKAEAEKLTDEILKAGLSIDKALVYTRMSKNLWSKVPMFDGRFTRVQRVYDAAVKTIEIEIKLNSLQMRQAQPIIQRVQRLSYPELDQWAEKFYLRANRALNKADAQFHINPKDDAFLKMSKQLMHKEEMHRIVTKMVSQLESFGDETNKRVVILWKYCVTYRTQPPYRYDRIIFQPNANGQKNVMDLLLEALVSIGWIKAPKS